MSLDFSTLYFQSDLAQQDNMADEAVNALTARAQFMSDQFPTRNKPIVAWSPGDPPRFAPGLHLLAGPSGSGKSTLLRALALRLGMVNGGGVYDTMGEPNSTYDLFDRSGIDVPGMPSTEDPANPQFQRFSDLLVRARVKDMYAQSEVRTRIEGLLQWRDLAGGFAIYDSFTFLLPLYGSIAGVAEGTMKEGLARSDVEAAHLLSEIARRNRLVVFASINSDVFPRTNDLVAVIQGIGTVHAAGHFTLFDRVTRTPDSFTLAPALVEQARVGMYDVDRKPKVNVDVREWWQSIYEKVLY